LANGITSPADAFDGNRAVAAGGRGPRRTLDERGVELDDAQASFTITTADGIFWISALAFLVRELAHVGDAHGALGLLVDQRDGEFAARIVAAAAAVQFVIARKLADVAQRLADLRIGILAPPPAARRRNWISCPPRAGGARRRRPGEPTAARAGA
jgi:hypothetical protein